MLLVPCLLEEEMLAFENYVEVTRRVVSVDAYSSVKTQRTGPSLGFGFPGRPTPLSRSMK
jgi:hypothetical protein